MPPVPYKDMKDYRTALVLYGSETGNAHDIADNLGRMLERLRFSTHVTHLDAVHPVCCHQCIKGSRLMAFSPT